MKEITKDFKSFTDFIYDVVSGKTEFYGLGEDEAITLDKKGYDLIQEKGMDMMMAKASKVAGLNVLDKNVDFTIFSQLPKVWYAYQVAAETALRQ